MEENVLRLNQRRIKAIQPDDWFIGFVYVVMPGPTWGEDQISRLHREPLALNDGVRIIALNDETNRREIVSMDARDLAGG